MITDYQYLCEFREFCDSIMPKYTHNIIYDPIKTKSIFKNEKICKTIHQDCLRSLWRYQSIFQQTTQSQDEQLLFEKFVIEILGNCQRRIQLRYFQTLTDILEIIFTTYLNFNRIVKNMSQYQNLSQSETYKQILYMNFPEFQDYFVLRTSKNKQNQTKCLQAIKLSICLINIQYIETRFQNQVFLNNCEIVNEKLKQQNKNYKKIASFIANDDKQILIASFMQYITNGCLHYISNIELSCQIAKFILKYTTQSMLDIDTQIIDWCIEIENTELLGSNLIENYIVNIQQPAEVQTIETYAIELITTAVGEVLQSSENSQALIKYLNEYVNKHNRSLQRRL